MRQLNEMRFKDSNIPEKMLKVTNSTDSQVKLLKIEIITVSVYTRNL